MFNHYPLPTARRLPNHAGEGDTANPHAAITCPECRLKLETKVQAHREEAVAQPNAEYRRFYAADASNWQSILDRN